jgi:BMFP domain-containing protein YqiC
MQTQNPFLDEFAKLTTAALGLAQAAGEEARTAFRGQAEKFVADFDLVRRDELEALKAELQALREEVAALKAKKAAKPKSSDESAARPAQEAG